MPEETPSPGSDPILRGNEIPAGILRSALKSGRVANAYLFKGPKGSPKEDFALEFARSLLCDREGPRQTGAACGECWSCRAVSNHAHPDLYEAEREGNAIKIRKSHEILKEAMSRPYHSVRKVFLVRDAEDLTAEASNALLKILEEPPAYVTFILTAMNLAAIPETIISRCQMVPFRRRARTSERSQEDARAGDELLADVLCGSPVDLALKYSRMEPARRVDVLDCLEIELVENLRARVAFFESGDSSLRQAERESKRLYRAVDSLRRAKERLDSNTNAFLTLSVLFMDLARTLGD